MALFMQFMHVLQNDFVDVFTHMKMVCYYHFNITYLTIIRLTTKYIYFQINIKSTSFTTYAIYDKNSYLKFTPFVLIFWSPAIALILK